MNGTTAKSILSPEIILQSFNSAILAVLGSITGGNASITDRQSFPNRIPSSDYYGETALDGVIRGQVSIAINQDAAKYVTAKLSWTEPFKLNDEEAADGVIELLNQVCGKFRAMLGEFKGQIEFNIPTVGQKTAELLSGIYDQRLSQLTVVKLNNLHISFLLLASYQS